MEHMPWYLAPRFHLTLLGLGLALFVGILIAGVLRFFRRKAEPAPAPPGRGVLFLVALAQIVFVILLVVVVSDPKTLMTGESKLLMVALVFPVLGALCTVAAVAAAVMRWKNKVGGFGGRLGYTIVVLIAVLYTWSLNTWNLLGWRM
jgi:hypothetical protein